jgi:hypothetical protein
VVVCNHTPERASGILPFGNGPNWAAALRRWNVTV